MSRNLNTPAVMPGKLSAADFQATVPYLPAHLAPHTQRPQPLELPAHLRGPKHPADPQPGALCADVSCDLDDDGGVWMPAPLSSVAKPLGATLLVVILVAVIVFADELHLTLGALAPGMLP